MTIHPFPRHRIATLDDLPRPSDENACWLVAFHIARCVYMVEQESLRKQQPDYEPRQMAVVVAENIGIPRKVVCEYFNVADSIITKWQMEFSVKCANDPAFRDKVQWISGSCRTNTGRR